MIEDVKKIEKEMDKSHSFLAEELLVPNMDKCDLNRLQMFTSHIAQTVVLKEPEFPRVFTNFENQVGNISSSFRIADDDLTIISKIIKNDMNYTLVVKNSKGYYDIIQRSPGERITEYYGYKLENDIIDTKKARDVISKGDVLYRSTSYDKDMNFMYGTNLKAVYIPYKNLTYEDGIVISESGAKKLESYTVNEVTVNINTNDVLVNIYGNDKIYKSFPDIGESIKDRILLSRRRINYESIYFDMDSFNLSKVNFNTDTPFYADGVIVDVDVYNNSTIEKLEQYPYNNQILRYLKGNMNYYSRIVEVLEPIMKRDKKYYSDDLAFLYKRAKDIVDPEVKWKNDKSDFDNLVVKFKILNEKKLVIGSKIANRFGKQN